MPALANGQTDLMWDTLYYTPERAQQMDFVIYLRAATGGLVAKGNPKHIVNLDTVCGTRASAALGSVEEAQFHKISDSASLTANQRWMSSLPPTLQPSTDK